MSLRSISSASSKLVAMRSSRSIRFIIARLPFDDSPVAVSWRWLRRLDPLADALLGGAEKLACIPEGEPDLLREGARCFDVQGAQLGLHGLLLRAGRPLSAHQSVHVAGKSNVVFEPGLVR
jgi:hypothetical protein